MTRSSVDACLRVIILSLLLQNCHGSSYQRLIRRRLRSNEMSIKGSDDIRNIISTSLTANEPAAINNNKRDTLSGQVEDQGSLDRFAIENNAAAESRDSSIYENDADEDDEVSRQKDDVEYKRSVDSESPSSSGQSDLTFDDESDLRDIKDNVKREAKNEEEYDEDDEVSSDSVETSNGDDRKELIGRSTIGASSSNELKKIDNPRDTSAVAVDSDLDYEKQIENQIQQRIDTIKEDIKREIEKKQMVREIEANNEKYDEIMDLRGEGDEVAAEEPSDSTKRSISVANNDVDSSDDNLAVRSKRSDLKNEVKPETPSDPSKRSIFVANNDVDSSEENLALKSKRSDVKSEVDKNVPLVLPVKKRSHPRHVVVVERDTRKRKSRSTILIPEQGHAEVKDDLPADLTLDPNLRIARSYDRDPTEQEVPRSLRSATKREDNSSGRHRRDMSEDSESEKFEEIDETPGETSNFLFASRGKSDDSRSRRRRSRGHDRTRSIDRGKGRKHPRRSTHHRAIRESSLNDSDLDEERDKRASSLDEDAALEYKESFGGFPSESGGALGRFKRIKRSTNIS